MSVSVTVEPRQFTADQIRDHVLAYASLPHGSKRKYLEEHGLTRRRMDRWRVGVTDGDVDAGQYPRKSGRMTQREVSEITRLKRLIAERDAQICKLEREVARSEKVADALGKAIDVMHSHGVEPDKAEND